MLLLFDYTPSTSELVGFCLPLFTNLRSFSTPVPTPHVLSEAFQHPSLKTLISPWCTDLLGFWWDMNHPQPLPRRATPLLLRPVEISTLPEFHEPPSFEHYWTRGVTRHKPSTSTVRELDWFFSSTTAANVVLPSLLLLGDASVPFPSAGPLSTSKLPSLEHLEISTLGIPTLAFVESLGTVALVQSPDSSFSLKFGSRHPLHSSLGALGRIPPFQELAGVPGWEQLGTVQVSIKSDREWGVQRVEMGTEEGSLTPSFLTSMGTSFRNLTTLILDMNPDGLSQIEPGWPADWVSPVAPLLSAFEIWQRN